MQRPATLRPGPALRELEALKADFGEGSAARKAGLLLILEKASLKSAQDVLRLHEVAAFLRAHPDDRQVLAIVERLLGNFARRADLRRFRRQLADSGIAGTALNYSFYSATARRLAARWGRHLHVNWRDSGPQARLEGRLALLASYAETPGLDEYYLPLKQWVARLKGPRRDRCAVPAAAARAPRRERGGARPALRRTGAGADAGARADDAVANHGPLPPAANPLPDGPAPARAARHPPRAGAQAAGDPRRSASATARRSSSSPATRW